jgi:hypothetical protein
MSGQRIKCGTVVVALLVVTSCGEPASHTLDGGSSSPSPSADYQAAVLTLPTVTMIEDVQQDEYLPVVLKPLPSDLSVTMQVAEVFDIISRDSFTSQYFVDSTQISGASVRLGYVSELNADGKEDPELFPPYPAFIVSGGSSECYPVGSQSSEASVVSLPCTTEIIVNIDSGEVRRSVDIMTSK